MSYHYLLPVTTIENPAYKFKFVWINGKSKSKGERKEKEEKKNEKEKLLWCNVNDQLIFYYNLIEMLFLFVNW